MTNNKDKKDEEVLDAQKTPIQDMAKEQKSALLKDLAGRLFEDEYGDGSDEHYYED